MECAKNRYTESNLFYEFVMLGQWNLLTKYDFMFQTIAISVMLKTVGSLCFIVMQNQFIILYSTVDLFISTK